MCNQVEVIHVVFYEVKENGKWIKSSRSFMNDADAVQEISTLQWFAEQMRTNVRKVSPKPMLSVLYPAR